MFFTRKRKRQKLLTSPLAPAVEAQISGLSPLYARAPEAVRERLAGPIQVLLEEKHWEGCDGLVLTDAMRLVIAAHAGLLQLRRDADFYPALDTVLVYPETFVVSHEVEDEHGFVREGEDELAGESWQRGVVILSWSDVQRDLADPDAGYDVIVHEFTHQLDEEAGAADGAPLLADPDLLARWTGAFRTAYDRHRKLLKRDREVLFDDNAAENPAEFLATAAEIFFTLPRDLKQAFPDVYAVVSGWLELDPAEW